ncbi:MAG: 5'/3'-nucleotidase SurE [Spirochaetota bacterium]
MKNILLSNDDGIHAAGLWALKRRLEHSHRVFVVAPDRERSAAGHAISLHDPIRLKVVEEGRVYAVNGTPVDAVHVALLGVVREKIDLVVAGVNHGLNLGSDVFYSGTVSAAFQAVAFGIPGIAVSIDIEGDPVCYDTAAYYAEQVVNKIVKSPPEGKMEGKIVLNLNVPNREVEAVRGVQLTSLGNRVYEDRLIEREDPKRNKYYWIDGSLVHDVPDEGTDVAAVKQGFVSITPLQKDITARDYLPRLKERGFDRLS